MLHEQEGSEIEETPATRLGDLQPREDGRDWHPAAVELWKAIKEAPQAQMLRKLDAHTLFPLIEMVHDWWTIGIYETILDYDSDDNVIGSHEQISLAKINTRKQLHAEIRLTEANYGFTPLDLKKLEWQIAETELAAAASERQRASRPRIGSRTSG